MRSTGIALAAALLLAVLPGLLSGEDMNSNEKIKAVTQLVPVMYNEDVSVADRIFDPECLHHVNGVTETTKGPQAIKDSIAAMKQMFTDIKTVIDEILAEDAKVSFRWTWTAKNLISGKVRTFHGITIFKFRDGRVIEEWAIDDRLREMQAQGFTLTPPGK